MKEKKKPSRIEWLILLGSILVFSAMYLYNDLPFSSAGGLRVWNCIQEGTFPLFYNSWYPGVENSALPNGSAGGEYDFLIYFIFALYNFPLWIWEKITDLRFIMFYPTRLYIKGILWVFSGMTAYFLYKIALLCKVSKENALWAPFLFLSSGIFFATEVTIGGYDVISVAFSVLGIYGYLKKDQKCFLLSFAAAIATKLFAFWLFVPLLLLKEKRIGRIILQMLLALSLIIIPKAYFAVASTHMVKENIRVAAEESKKAETDTEDKNKAEGGSAGKSENSAAAAKTPQAKPIINDIIAHSNIINDALFPTEYTANYTFFSLSNLPLIFVGMFTIWIGCYLIKREPTEREVLYLCALVMGVFIATVKIHPYWGILLAPYLSLLVVLRPEKLRENLILETLISAGYVLNKAILYPWCFGMSQIERMVGPEYVFGYDRDAVNMNRFGIEGMVYQLSKRVGISENNIAHVFSALFVVALTIFLLINRPGKEEADLKFIGEDQEARRVLIFRFLFSLFVAALPLIGLLMYVSPFNWGCYD